MMNILVFMMVLFKWKDAMCVEPFTFLHRIMFIEGKKPLLLFTVVKTDDVTALMWNNLVNECPGLAYLCQLLRR